MAESIVYTKSYAFAIRIVKLYSYLKSHNLNYGPGNQVLRSGTSIGANANEAKYAQSDADFISKLRISLKEANETRYWLSLMKDTDIISEEQADSMLADCEELIKILVSIVLTSQNSKP